MARKEFVLSAGRFKYQHLTLEWQGNFWQGNFKDLIVSVDNQQIGVIETRLKLTYGASFTLPDNSELTIKLDQSALIGRFTVIHDGKLVSGSDASADNDDVQVWKTAYQIIMFLGGLWLGLGIVAELFQVEFLMNFGLGLFSAISGLILLGLGNMVQQKSLIALYLAIGLYALDGIFTLIVIVAESEGSSGIGGLFVRGMFLWAMMKGVPALQTIKREQLA